MQPHNYEWPELSQHGKEVAQQIIDKFREKLTEVTNEVMVDFTRNISEELDVDDAWIQFRQKWADCLKYSNGTEKGYWDRDWQEVRRRIFEENRDAIINDIIVDKEKEIADLKGRIAYMEEERRNRY